MLAAVDEIVRVLDGTLKHSRSSGRNGIAAREILIGIHNSRLTGSQSNFLLEDRDRTLEVRSR
jgi:hypothetical protein